VVRTATLDGKPFTVRMPAGTYDLSSPINTDNPEPAMDSFTMVAQPELKLTKNTVVTLDARKGKKAAAKVDSATAEPVGLHAIWIDNGSLYSRVRGGDDGNVRGELYAVPTGPVRSYSYTYGFTGSLAEPEGKRGYVLYLTEEGRIPDPLLRVRDRELATVRTQLHGEGVDVDRPAHLRVVVSGDTFLLPLGYDVQVPSERIDLYSARPDVKWQSELSTDHTVEYDYDADSGISYQPGRQYTKHWGEAAIGPSFRPSFAYERLWAGTNAFSSSAAGNTTGLSFNGGDLVTAVNTLRKNGTVIDSNDQPDGGTFETVDPNEAATYQLSSRMTRQADWSTLATRVDASWTFKGPFEEFGRPSALVVRADGAFDLLNRAPAGEPFTLRVSVENVDRSTPRVRRIELRSSFDDGRTWTTLRLVRIGSAYWATVPKPPASARFVSLRALAEASDGAKVEQTVIRSYGLRR
jgi:hypothetical protein